MKIVKNVKTFIFKMCYISKTEKQGRTTRFIFYKNTVYKNIEAEICRKIKNMLRIFPAEDINGVDIELLKRFLFLRCACHTYVFSSLSYFGFIK